MEDECDCLASANSVDKTLFANAYLFTHDGRQFIEHERCRDNRRHISCIKILKEEYLEAAFIYMLACDGIIRFVLVNLFIGTEKTEKPVDRRSYFQVQELQKQNQNTV
ncbi:hypothetical protein H3S89_08780 [Bartonella sp. B10834G6]|uniref:hypothetical protein n=1 Tax=Bartonella apis TaxID=1686310 RepID=UPI0018DDB277|nr:hypothetical protein [Bartonella apis]MBH9982884.1 hypothetical protein [Bartonella apis]